MFLSTIVNDETYRSYDAVKTNIIIEHVNIFFNVYIFDMTGCLLLERHPHVEP